LLAARRRYDESLELGRRILLDDPFHECAFQEVLCIHVLNGQRGKALQLFDEFSRSLQQELGILPMAETRALRDYVAGSANTGELFSNFVVNDLCVSARRRVDGLIGSMENSRQPAEHFS
jgi:DNA-binding SARP family transcriptional activator